MNSSFCSEFLLRWIWSLKKIFYVSQNVYTHQHLNVIIIIIILFNIHLLLIYHHSTFQDAQCLMLTLYLYFIIRMKAQNVWAQKRTRKNSFQKPSFIRDIHFRVALDHFFFFFFFSSASLELINLMMAKIERSFLLCKISSTAFFTQSYTILMFYSFIFLRLCSASCIPFHISVTEVVKMERVFCLGKQENRNILCLFVCYRHSLNDLTDCAYANIYALDGYGNGWMLSG